MQELYLVLNCSKGENGTNSGVEVFNNFEMAEDHYKEIVKDAMNSYGIDYAVEMWSIPTMVGFKVNFDEDTVIDIHTPHREEKEVHTWNTNGQRDELDIVSEDEEEHRGNPLMNPNARIISDEDGLKNTIAEIMFDESYNIFPKRHTEKKAESWHEISNAMSLEDSEYYSDAAGEIGRAKGFKNKFILLQANMLVKLGFFK